MSIAPYFEDIQSRILSRLSAAKKSVKAAVAWLTDIQSINALQDLAANNISIEIILNDDDINKSKSHELAKLEESGASIYYHPAGDGLMHHKFCIIDNEILIMGSYNWTYSAANSNTESIVVIENEPETLAHFCEEFSSLKKRLKIVEAGIPVIHSELLEIKTEIYFLENDIASLEVKKAEMEKVILDFESKLKLETGDLIFEKLTLEKKLQELIAQLTNKQDDFEVLQEKQQNIDSFEKAWFEAKARENITLSEPDEAQMKRMYREAMMMAHPDRFMNEPEKYEEANRLSSILTDAYQTKNFQKLEEIYSLLKDGLAFKSDWFNSNDENYFKKLLALLKTRKQNLEQKIALLGEHKVWAILQSDQDYEAYFNLLKNTLLANISMLKNEIKKYE